MKATLYESVYKSDSRYLRYFYFVFKNFCINGIIDLKQEGKKRRPIKEYKKAVEEVFLYEKSTGKRKVINKEFDKKKVMKILRLKGFQRIGVYKFIK